MLNRRFLRFKVLQAIYAFLQSGETDTVNAERRLLSDVDNLYALFIRQLSFWVEVRDFAERRIEENKAKHFPTEEDLNPNMKFVNNIILSTLSTNKDLAHCMEDNKISWADDREDFIRAAYNRLREFPEYTEYMSHEGNTFKEDKQLILNVIDNHLADDELIFDYYADKNLDYTSDYPLGVFLLWKFINELDESFNENSLLPTAYKTQKDLTNDDKNFVIQLFRQTIKHADEYRELVKNSISNWDYERVALMDRIIIFMALTEFTQFSQIPVKVTINEYIEMAKYFSTPDSRRFVNGILDNLSEQLKKDGKLVKHGRGLV